MKKCGHCKLLKEDKEFSWRNRAKGVLASLCKPCQYAYQKQWYRRNRKRHMANVGIRNRRVADEHYAAIFAYLQSHPCVDCGEKDPLVLEFDHQYGKRNSISQLVGCTQVRIARELKKCDVRCANCHRRRTAAQLGWRRYKLANSM